MQRLGLVKKLDICIPRELKEIHSTKRINACDLHLKRNEFDPFFNPHRFYVYDRIHF